MNIPNPLLDFSGLPRFPDILPEHVTPAIESLLEDNRALLDSLTRDEAMPLWENFVGVIEDANERLSRAWGQVSHLNSVINGPELREAYNANLPRVTAYYADLSQNEALFEKYRRLRKSSYFTTLTGEQRQIIDNELRDFRLGGAELPAQQKVRFKEIQEELSSLGARFEENLLDATNAFALYIEDETQLSGMPADATRAAREDALKEGKSGWKFTLRAPSWLPVMQYADNRQLRERLYREYVTRASEFGAAEWDNTSLIQRLLKLRNEAAKLLGFANYSELSLATKMAESPGQVLSFLNELAERAKPYAQRDLAELQAFANEALGLEQLEVWDIAYASEKLRIARYAYSDNDVKQYFPEDQVLPGMFTLVETLYGLTIESEKAPTWHPDVRFFTIYDTGGAPVGQFYIDLYARENKRGGAWMDEAITRRRKLEVIQIPVAYLNCNFSPPVGTEPGLLTHDEVNTLFHEFGHGLHHMLTRAEELGVSGINGVEWDAVELPSQFMENFCWEWEVVNKLSRHVATGESLPRELFDKMLAARNFQSGMQTVRQLEFALFDMHLHYDFNPEGNKTALDLLTDIRDRVAVIIPPAYNRFPNNFSHIFAGGYAAGYYSYKWAEVLSADAYSLFEENGVLNADVGHRFWNEILAVGGSRPALASFISFRGREPNIDALLRHNGMI